MKKIGVLNLQGAVSEHIDMINHVSGTQGVPVRHPKDLIDLAGLIIPGGESTAISRLIQENQLFEPIKAFSDAGKGIFGTCAGLVLCSSKTTHSKDLDKSIILLNLIDIVTERNGFGRQIDSFETHLDIEKIGAHFPAIFIRAPYIVQYSKSVTPLAYIDNRCVMAESENIMVCSFHPELTQDRRIIKYFINNLCN
ncbi:pyridoxal 5'-phosphate synthase glutaminase subunit PdxT [Orbaceae bacterium ac157xtp]